MKQKFSAPERRTMHLRMHYLPSRAGLVTVSLSDVRHTSYGVPHGSILINEDLRLDRAPVCIESATEALEVFLTRVHAR